MAPIVRSTRNCPNTPMVVFALAEAKQGYDTVIVPDGWFDERYGIPGPALEDGTLVVVETGAILRHIARAYDFAPAGLAGLAEMDRWLDFHNRRLVRARGAPAELARLLGVLDRHLADRDWMLGAFSITDCGYLPLAQRRPPAPPPRVAAYLDRLQERASR